MYYGNRLLHVVKNSISRTSSCCSVWSKRQTKLISVAAAAAASSSSVKNEDWTMTVAVVTTATAAVAAAAGLGSICLCEEHNEHPTNEFRRYFSRKDGIRDPMTSYQKYAMAKEIEEEEVNSNELLPVDKKIVAPEVSRHVTKDVEKTSVPKTYSEHNMDTTTTRTKEPTIPLVVVQQVTATSSSSSSTTNNNIKNPATGPVDLTAQESMTQQEARIEEATRKAKQHSGGLKIFSGNGNMSLALEIARHLGVNIGRATVGKFADGEVNVVIHENVRGKDCYIIQPTGPPVNDNIMELLLMISTLRRSSARRITVVIPYYGYARQDRKMQARVPISAADVARLMESMGIDRVIAVDLHCGQIQGFFGPRVPVDNLDGGIVGLDYFGCKDLHNPVIVSPDAGGVYRAKKFKEGLEQKYDMQDLGLAMIVKQRARAGSVDQMDLVGDVRDCDCIVVDDMIDTAGTLCKAADVLVANGARRVFAFASHGLLSGPGNERIANSALEEVVILNTLPTSPQREANEKLTELSVAPLLAQAIFNIHAKKSISALFK